MQELVEGPVTDERVGEVEDPLRRLRVATRRDLGFAKVRDQSGDDEHDDEVHTERDPVLCGADLEAVVRRDEDEVEGEEPRPNRKRSGGEAPDSGSGDDGEHEDECRGRNTQMTSQWQHRRAEHDHPDDRDRRSEKVTPSLDQAHRRSPLAPLTLA